MQGRTRRTARIGFRVLFPGADRGYDSRADRAVLRPRAQTVSEAAGRPSPELPRASIHFGDGCWTVMVPEPAVAVAAKLGDELSSKGALDALDVEPAGCRLTARGRRLRLGGRRRGLRQRLAKLDAGVPGPELGGQSAGRGDRVDECGPAVGGRLEKGGAFLAAWSTGRLSGRPGCRARRSTAIDPPSRPGPLGASTCRSRLRASRRSRERTRLYRRPRGRAASRSRRTRRAPGRRDGERADHQSAASSRSKRSSAAAAAAFAAARRLPWRGPVWQV